MLKKVLAVVAGILALALVAGQPGTGRGPSTIFETVVNNGCPGGVAVELTLAQCQPTIHLMTSSAAAGCYELPTTGVPWGAECSFILGVAQDVTISVEGAGKVYDAAGALNTSVTMDGGGDGGLGNTLSFIFGGANYTLKGAGHGDLDWTL